MEKKIHHGKNIMRFRQMRGLKQDALASLLGDDWNQIKVSRLEAKEEVETTILEQIANVLNVPTEALRNFDDDGGVNLMANTVNFQDQSAAVQNYRCTFNPLDKYVEAMEENKRLHEELLKVEREKIALLEKMLRERK